MRVGFHFIEESYSGPPLGAGVALDPSEWAAPRGHLAAGREGRRLMRPYFKGNPSPAWFAEQARRWHAAGWRVQVGNEPNHPIEEWQGGPAAYRAFFAEVRRLAPDVPLYWAGMSPSIPGWQTWYDGAEAADGIAGHAYGSGEELRGPVWYLRQRFPNVPLFLAEFNFGPGPGRWIDRDRWAREELRPFLDWCAGQGVEAATYFAWKWPTPDMETGTPVDAAGTEIERVLREWREPLPAPPPPQEPAMYSTINLPTLHYSQRAGAVARWIIVHTTEGDATLPAAAQYLRENTRRVSAHELVGDGVVYVMAPDAVATHHAGDDAARLPTGETGATVNRVSWGIELHNRSGVPPSALTYRIAVERIAAAARRLSIPVERIIAHRAVDPTRRTDPTGVNMDTLRADVAALLSPPAPPPPPAPPELPAPLKAAARAAVVLPVNPEAALTRAILADSYIPNGVEVFGDGMVAQSAEKPGSRPRVYYVRIGDWGNVYWQEIA